MKRNFGVRRVYVRGEEGIRNDLGLLLLSMDLSKLAEMVRRNGKKDAKKPFNSTHKNKNRKYLIH